MVTLHSWTQRFVCGFSTWQSCRCCQWRPSKVVPVPGAGFPCGLPRAGSCAGCRAQMWAQNQTWDFPSLSLASALDYGSSHSSALRRGTAPAELLVDLPAGSKKSEWCGAAWPGLIPSEISSSGVPRRFCTAKTFRMNHGGNPWGKQQVTTKILLWSSFLYLKYYQNKTKACVITDILCQILPGHEGVWIKTQ